MRRVQHISAVVTILSWLGLSLEIVIWHDVTQSQKENPLRAPLGSKDLAEVGWYPFTLLAGAVLAPGVYITCGILRRRQR